LGGGDFNAKLGREDNLKPKTGNYSLHKINNGNGFRVVNFQHRTINCEK
jgi:hypothetical protein